MELGEGFSYEQFEKRLLELSKRISIQCEDEVGLDWAEKTIKSLFDDISSFHLKTLSEVIKTFDEYLSSFRFDLAKLMRNFPLVSPKVIAKWTVERVEGCAKEFKEDFYFEKFEQWKLLEQGGVDVFYKYIQYKIDMVESDIENQKIYKSLIESFGQQYADEWMKETNLLKKEREDMTILQKFQDDMLWTKIDDHYEEKMIMKIGDEQSVDLFRKMKQEEQEEYVQEKIQDIVFNPFHATVNECIDISFIEKHLKNAIQSVLDNQVEQTKEEKKKALEILMSAKNKKIK